MSSHYLIAHFFLALNHIPLSGCTTISIFTYGRTSWLQVLAIMKKELLVSVYGFYMDIWTPLSKYQGTWILDHMVRVCFVLYETAKLSFFFFNFAFQPAMNGSFCCSTCSSAIVTVSILEFSHSSVSSFYLYFLYTALMLSLRNTI